MPFKSLNQILSNESAKIAQIDHPKNSLNYLKTTLSYEKYGKISVYFKRKGVS